MRRRPIAEYYQGPVELRIVATKGKGENLERPELAVIEQQLRSRELDLLIYEGTQFRELVEQAHRERVGTSAEQWTKPATPEMKLVTQMGNIVELMTEYGPTKRIAAKVEEIKQLEQQLASDRRALKNLARRELILPRFFAISRVLMGPTNAGCGVA
jgi:hypothetical protein